MKSDEKDPKDTLAEAEKIIKVLETLAIECERRNFHGLAIRIGQCLAKCQSLYVKMQRRAFKDRGFKRQRRAPTAH